jgi:starch phosphorylase
MDKIFEKIELRLKQDHQVTPNEATVYQIHDALSKLVMDGIADTWYESRHMHERSRGAYYFSAEYLTGRMVYNNLYNLGLLDKVKAAFAQHGLDINMFEEIEDCALGNGGLGRLAACFLDSAATHDLPLDGYGIRYKYGLFKQSWRDGYQHEAADDWQRFGDPWSRRRSTHEVLVKFADQTVRAVPYDMPIIGYHTDNIGTLRLWQSEAVEDFDFQMFNEQEYAEAVKEKNAVEDITRVLYPNDTTRAGKKLRLKQQYFLSSASLQDLMLRFKRENLPMEKFAAHNAIQLNDTHPTVSIPELIRLLTNEGLTFEQSFDIAQKTFGYTNHTVMQEALEKWDADLFKELLPEIFDIIYRINAKLCGELMSRGIDCSSYAIIQGNRIHMANLAVYVSHAVNGVAKIHSEILKNDVLKNWYELYPERFQNKTNGITQRRWLGLCNPELCGLIASKIGPGFITDLDELKKLVPMISPALCKKFISVKKQKKQQLSAEILRREGIALDPSMVFDVQIKRLHEYKRQFMNALSILAIYDQLKRGRLKDLPPVAFIFGAKAAPGYDRAKAVIHWINMIADKVNNDPKMQDRLKVVFVRNYNCSWAKKIIPAADISEQISPAGTEASGTGNMKLMLNGAVTLGTFDGANVEIVEEAGRENNYIFGATVEELEKIKDSYDPVKIYNKNALLRRALDTLVDGTFPDDDGRLKELHDAILKGASWHKPDHYYVMKDFGDYYETKLQAIRDAKADETAFARKCLMNVACSGKFSSDRTIRQYAKEIWKV